MTSKHELKKHISELREIIKLKDAQITNLEDIIKQSYTGSHDLEKLPYPYDRSIAKIIRLGDIPNSIVITSKPIFKKNKTNNDELNKFLNSLLSKILKIKSNEEIMLRDMYGDNWITRLDVENGVGFESSGYKACIEILNYIDLLLQNMGGK